MQQLRRRRDGRGQSDSARPELGPIREVLFRIVRGSVEEGVRMSALIDALAPAVSQAAESDGDGDDDGR